MSSHSTFSTFETVIKFRAMNIPFIKGNANRASATTEDPLASEAFLYSATMSSNYS